MPKVKSNLQAVVGSNTKYESRSTGELVDALGVTSPKQDKDGNFNIKIGFAEPRKDSGKQKSSATQCLPVFWNTGNPASRRGPFETGKNGGEKAVYYGHD